jgi:hypothetical protein
MAPTAPLPDLPPPPVTGAIADGRPFVIALSLTLLGGTLAGWQAHEPRTATGIIGASILLGGIAQGLALRLGFADTRAPVGMTSLTRFPALRAAPLAVRGAAVAGACGLSQLSDQYGCRQAILLLGVIATAWLMPELVRQVDAWYCQTLQRFNAAKRPLPPLPIAIVQGVAMAQVVLGLIFVLTRG